MVTSCGHRLVSEMMTSALLAFVIVQAVNFSGSEQIGVKTITADVCHVVLSRGFWGANPPKQQHKLNLPVPEVIIHHTYIPKAANTTQECIAHMKSIQHYHQITKGWDDIGYNFVICGDENIYEGRGWYNIGAHATTHNSHSIGIAFIGDYTDVLPSTDMLQLAKHLITCGLEKNIIIEDYVLYGHRDVGNTECPGNTLYGEICTWPHHFMKKLSN
uniref:Peptidoglycan-recognition protein n=1 Tax=Laodelphax striatellus TaxID=195883 RepID=A0A286JZ75_LAOST|nr:peptidoglycan recognition protein [Laodelphax striatellus]